MTTALAVVVDVSVVAALALIACRLLGRRPASLRHAILGAALAAGATAPILEAALPQWHLPIRAVAAQPTSGKTQFIQNPEPAVSTGSTRPSESVGFTWSTLLIAVWALGVAVVLGSVIVGAVRLRAITARCRALTSGPWPERASALARQLAPTRRVVVLESPDRALLLTCGLFRPRVIVPPGAESWGAERIDVVLAHELAHIARGDWAMQIAAESIRAVYWFNPLIWSVCRRLRDESEEACDDIVLQRGIGAADYASHLLAIAKDLLAVDRAWAAAPAAASRSTLEKRIAAILSTGTRRPLPLSVRAAAVVVLLSLTAPVAAVTLTERVDETATAPAVAHDIVLAGRASVATARVSTPGIAMTVTRPGIARMPETPVPILLPARMATPAAAPAPAQQNPSTLSGVLRDATGAVLPGVAVTITDKASGMSSSATTDANGAFTIRRLPPSTYEFRASLPGFALLTDVVVLAAGEEVQRRWELRVGGLAETLTVECPARVAVNRAASGVFAFGSAQAPAILVAQQTAPVRVGGNIAAPRRVKTVQPRCPGVAVPDSVTVVLEVTIDVDGLTRDITSLRPTTGQQTPPEFVDSAIEALRQWQYTPVRLNGTPVAVRLVATIVYRRQF